MNFIEWPFFFSPFVRVIKTEKILKTTPTITVAACFQQVLNLYIFLARFSFVCLALKEINRKWLNNLYLTISDYFSSNKNSCSSIFVWDQTLPEHSLFSYKFYNLFGVSCFHFYYRKIDSKNWRSINMKKQS